MNLSDNQTAVLRALTGALDAASFELGVSRNSILAALARANLETDPEAHIAYVLEKLKTILASLPETNT